MGRGTSTRWALLAALAAMAALVVSPAATTASYSLVPGTPTTVTISNAGGSATATFAGAAGQRISLNFGSVTITSSSVSIKKPDGTNLVPSFTVTKSGYFFDVHTLPADGTYKVVINAKSDYTGRMTLKLFDVPADSSQAILADGAPHTVTTGTPGENALLTFSGTAGQRVSVNLTGVTIKAAKLRVLTPPDGAPLYSTALSFGVAGGFLEPKAPLPTTGAYTLVVDPTLTYTGSATVQLYDVPPDDTGSIATNGSVSALSTTVPGQNASRTFTLAAAGRVSLELTNSSYGSAKVSLVKLPERTPMFSPSKAISPLGTYISPVSLGAGDYEVFVNPQLAETGGVDLQVFVVPPDVQGPITPGTPLPLTTSAPGQDAYLSFAGTAGERYSLNLTGSTIASAKAWIFKASDPAVKSPSVTVTSGIDAFLEPWKLPSNGTYKVKIDPVDAAYGSVSVGLYFVHPDVSTTIAPDGSPVTVSTIDPGQNAKLTFTLGAQKRVSLELTGVTMASSPTSGLKFKITKPDGSTLTSETLGTNGTYVDTQSLTQLGTYTIGLDPVGAVYGSATVKLHTVPADVPGAILANGTPVSVAVATPGQNAYLTFNGTLGQRVAFQVSSLTAPQPKVWLEKVVPAGSPTSYVFFKQTVNVDPQWFDTKTLPSTAQYKIVFDPQGSSTGGATFKLWTVPADLTGTVGPSTTAAVSTPGQNGVYTFTVAAGDLGKTAKITPVSGGTYNLVDVELIGPADDHLDSNSWNSTSGASDYVSTGVLDIAGTYTFVFDPVGNATGSMTFGLSVS